MRVNRIVVAACAAVVAAGAAATATAETYEALYKACFSSGMPDQVIASCSVVIGQRLAETEPRGLGRFVQRGNARSAGAGDGEHKRLVRINRRGGRMVRARLFRLCCEKPQDRPAWQPD